MSNKKRRSNTGRLDKLEVQVINQLNELARYGESKVDAKAMARETNFVKGHSNFADTSPYIHSFKTMDNYQQVGREFVSWLTEERAVPLRAPLKNMEKYVTEYLDYRVKSGLSIATIKRDRAGLGKLYGKSFDYKLETQKEITRSRGSVVRDKHFSVVNNQDLVNLIQGVGFRRSELEQARKSDFYYKDKQLMIEITGKGGKTRQVMVLPSKQADIEKILDFRADNELLFERVHSGCDVHNYRSEYARLLYKEVVDSKLVSHVHDLGFEKRSKHNDKSPHLTELRSKGRVFDRDALLIVSQMLGHESIRTSVNNYLIR